MQKHTFTASDGVEIAYYIDDFTDPWKPAESLLMLHSAMGSSKRFFSMVPGLARRFRVIRADTRGHGASQIPPENLPFDKERLMKDALELLDHLKIAVAHLVGNSAGGYAAQQLAIHEPKRIKSLVLFGSAPGFKGEQGKGWLRDIAKRGMRPVFTDSMADRLPIGEVDQRLVDWRIDEICKNDPNYIVRYLGYWTDTDFTDEIHGIKCPTLIVGSGAEPIGHASTYQEMQKRIAGAELIYYEKARHSVCDYLPDRCVSDVLKFHDRHFPAR